MVLEAHGIAGDTYWSLITEGLQHRAYCDRGWIHQGLVDMAARRGVIGRAVRGADWGDVAGEIDSGRLVIASVTACFLGGQPRAAGGRYSPGGHLVLVTGTRHDKAGLSAVRVHHPSATLANNWANRWIEDVAALHASFSGNYLVFNPRASVGGSIVP